MNSIETGKLIAELRKRKGLTQEALAEKLNISSKSISRWESGHNMPKYTVLEQLANELDTDIPSLLGMPQITNNQNVLPTIKSKIYEFFSPSLSKKSKIYFAGLTMIYLLFRYSFTWTMAHYIFLLASIFCSNLLFGLTGYFLLRKKAFIIPITAYVSSFVFYLVVDIILGNTIVSSFYMSAQFAQWNFIIVAISTIVTYIAHRLFLMTVYNNRKPYF